jgi:RimJ/RimL family protein N-acetyltransferase
VIGHCFLAADKPGCAELAIFVDQEFRRKGVGTALVKTALERAELTGLRRVWTMTSSDNQAALHLQQKCGFRLTNFVFPAVELQIDLPVADAIIMNR